MLTFITYAGCSLSVICLLLSLFAFHCFGSGGDRICIHNNLCFCLLVAETVFLLGIWQTQNKVCSPQFAYPDLAKVLTISAFSAVFVVSLCESPIKGVICYIGREADTWQLFRFSRLNYMGVCYSSFTQRTEVEF